MPNIINTMTVVKNIYKGNHLEIKKPPRKMAYQPHRIDST